MPLVELKLIQWFPNKMHFIYVCIEKANMVIQAKKNRAISAIQPTIPLKEKITEFLKKWGYPYFQSIVTVYILKLIFR